MAWGAGQISFFAGSRLATPAWILMAPEAPFFLLDDFPMIGKSLQQRSRWHGCTIIVHGSIGDNLFHRGTTHALTDGPMCVCMYLCGLQHYVSLHIVWYVVYSLA